MQSYRNVLRTATLSALLLAIMWAKTESLGLTLGTAGSPILCMALGLAAGHFYRPGFSVWVDRLVSAIEALALLAFVGLAGAIGSYAAAASSDGFVDPGLATFDRWIGLDWLAYWDWVHTHPLAARILEIGYGSILLFPSLLILALCVFGRLAEAYRLLLAMLVSLILTVLIFPFLPARSAAPHLLGGAAPHVECAQVIEALRNGTMGEIPLDHIVALITFPSFHASCAILFGWGSLRLRWLAPFAVALNIIMFASTPIEGSHFFIDLFGGTATAVLGIRLSARAPAIEAWFRRRRWTWRAIPADPLLS